IKYNWAPSTGLNDTSSATPVASPVASTMYQLIVTDSLGCKDTDQVQVLINNVVANANGYFEPLSSGVDNTVRALYNHNGELVLGGDFINGGGSILNHISIWNGISYLPLKSGGIGVNGSVKALSSIRVILSPDPLIFEDYLYAGGSF